MDQNTTLHTSDIDNAYQHQHQCLRHNIVNTSPKSAVFTTKKNMERRPRSLSQKLSSSFDIPLKKKSPVSPIRRPKHSRVASESFIASNASGIYKGQIVGSPSRKGYDHLTYLNHDDINRRAIQIFHIDGNSQVVQQDQSVFQRLLRIIHPNDPFRRMFDLATVIWVLLLVFFIPLEIGFVWYEARKAWKIIFVILGESVVVIIVLGMEVAVHHLLLSVSQ